MKNRILIMFVAILLLLPASVSATTLSQKYNFDKPTIKEVLIGNATYHSVTIAGLDSNAPTGEPLLPFKTAKILVPQGAQVKNVVVKMGSEEQIPGKYNVEIAQRPIPLLPKEELIKKGFSASFTKIKPEIEALTDYPAKKYSKTEKQKLEGYDIISVNIYPVKYNIKEGKLSYFKSVTVGVDYSLPGIPLLTRDAAIRGIARTSLFRATDKGKERAKKIVDNPSILKTYNAKYSYKQLIQPGIVARVIARLTGKAIDGGVTEKAIIEGGQYDYIIITNREFANLDGDYTFKTLAEWKIKKGLKTKIVTVEDIYSNYSGKDEQEKIRNFIKDAYLNWNTQYILLGGDADRSNVGGESGNNIVPVRRMGTANDWGWGSDYMISDVYYSNLDGTFDYDGDGIYGEANDGEDGGEVDLYAEVFVGRAPVDSAAEIANFVRKTIFYEDATMNNASWLRNALMAGEDLYWSTASIYKNEIKDGSSSSGYVTEGLPASMNIGLLYDNTKYDDGADYSWPKSELIGRINNNEYSEINHLGHAWVNYVMKMYNKDLDNLTNDKPFFAYSQGCYPGAFDNTGSEKTDSAGEHFVTNPTGAFAVIMNARYGWGAVYPSTDGPSQRHDRRFFNAIYGDGVTQLGKANAYAKEGLIGYITTEPFMKGIYYETNLLGDPETSFIIPPPLEHDISIKGIDMPQNALLNRAVEIKTVIKNQGKNDESNIVVSLYVNSQLAESKNIDYLASQTNTTLSFSYTFTTEGGNNISILAGFVPGEDNVQNNQVDKGINIVHMAFTNEYIDYGTDKNGNGLYDAVIIEVGVDSLKESYASVQGALYSQDGYYIGWTSNSNYINGKQKVLLVFSSYNIARYQINGPYKLKYLYLYGSRGNQQDYRQEAYTTNTYSWKDFDVPRDIGVRFNWSDDYRKIVGETTKIGVFVYNDGVNITEAVKLFLYEQKEFWNGSEWIYNSTLIGSKSITAPSTYEEAYTEFVWTPKELGSTNLLVTANISNDISPENNYNYRWYEIVNPSKIFNTGEANLSGYLLMKLQYHDHYGNYEWEDDRIIINDLARGKKTTITPRNSLDLTEIWNVINTAAVYHNNSDGHERVYVALLSREGNVIKTDCVDSARKKYHLVEGEDAKENEYIVISRYDDDYYSRILKVDTINIDYGAYDYVKFVDAFDPAQLWRITGDFSTGFGFPLDGLTYYITASGTGALTKIKLTWGKGASPGNPGSHTSIFDCPQNNLLEATSEFWVYQRWWEGGTGLNISMTVEEKNKFINEMLKKEHKVGK